MQGLVTDQTVQILALMAAMCGGDLLHQTNMRRVRHECTMMTVAHLALNANALRELVCEDKRGRLHSDLVDIVGCALKHCLQMGVLNRCRC